MLLSELSSFLFEHIWSVKELLENLRLLRLSGLGVISDQVLDHGDHESGVVDWSPFVLECFLADLPITGLDARVVDRGQHFQIWCLVWVHISHIQLKLICTALIRCLLRTFDFDDPEAWVISIGYDFTVFNGVFL